MSTGICMSKFWSDWTIVETGGSNVTVNADSTLATCTAVAGTERGYMRKYLPARPSERVKFSFYARRISGEPQASIDYPAAGQSVAVVDIDSDEFQEYTLEFLVPLVTNEASDYMQCTAGVFTTPAGSCEITSPRIEVSDASQGFLRVWCAGIVQLDRVAGVTTAKLNDKFVNAGIKSVNWIGGGTKKLVVETQKSPNLSLGVRPILSAEFTMDLLPTVVAKAGQYTPTSGEFAVQFNDGSSNFIDINNAMTDGQSCYLSVWAMGL